MAEPFVLHVFTHPACPGCPAAVKLAWELAQSRADIELRTIKLESKEGLATAHRHKVKSIPTLILFEGERELDRWVGTPSRGEIRDALEAR